MADKCYSKALARETERRDCLSRVVLNSCNHAACGVEGCEFVGVELVLDDEGAVFDPPQPLPDPESGEQYLFGAGQSQGLCGGAELVGFLPVDDPGLRIRQKAGLMQERVTGWVSCSGR